MRLAAILLLAAVILTAIAHLRPPEYDEAYSIFLTAGDPRPAWPTTPFHPAAVRALYAGQATLTQIAQNLRTGDVHPPLYFWTLELWRHLFGPAWFTSRLLSIFSSLATLATLAHLAKLIKAPVISTILITLLAYGYAYTSTITRGFALAQLLTTLGLTLAVQATQPRHASNAKPVIPAKAGIFFLAGLMFGAATFTNYLTLFTPLATLLWLLTRRHCEERSDKTIHLRRHAPLPRNTGMPAKEPVMPGTAGRRGSGYPRLTSFLATATAFTLFLPADAYFFTAQHASRQHQFTPFHPIHALTLLAKDFGATLFGGLPLYASPYGATVAATLAVFFLICLPFIKPRPLFILTTIATPIGLFLLGLIFNNTPIEIRYCSFSIPSLALLLATLPTPLRTTLILLESLGTIGLAFAPSTMQPQALAAHQAAALTTPQTLTLIPFGNDGVGIPGPFIAAAPNNLTIQIIKSPPDLTRQTHIILATITADDSSRLTVAATLATLAALASNPCWRRTAATQLTQSFTRTCP
jgi:hypothetical protein